MHPNLWRLAFGSNVPFRKRAFALYNLLGFGYFSVLFLMDTSIILLVMLPAIFEEEALYVNIFVAVYLSISVGVNFHKAVTTNTETDALTTAKNGRSKGDKMAQLPQCNTCNKAKPIRSHHCWLCDVCIKKRDHHCFFMGACIGEQNQKYFIAYCFFQFLAGLYFILVSALYLLVRFRFTFDGIKFVILPFLIIFRTIMEPGSVDLYFAYCVGMMYGTMVAMLIGGGFFVWQLLIVLQGLTSHEMRSSGVSEIKNEHWTVREKLNDVFHGGTLQYFAFPFQTSTRITADLADKSKENFRQTKLRKEK